MRFVRSAKAGKGPEASIREKMKVATRMLTCPDLGFFTFYYNCRYFFEGGYAPEAEWRQLFIFCLRRPLLKDMRARLYRA